MQTNHFEELEYIIRLNWKKFSAAPIKVYLVVYVIFPCGSFFTRSPHFFSIICAEVNLAYMCGKILHLNISCKKMFHQHSRNKVIIGISWCCWLVKLRKSFTRFSFGKKSNKVKRESLINIDDICLFVMVVLLNSHIHNIGNYMGKIST